MAKYNIGDMVTYGRSENEIYNYFTVLGYVDDRYFVESANGQRLLILFKIVDGDNYTFKKITKTDILLYFNNEIVTHVRNITGR